MKWPALERLEEDPRYKGQLHKIDEAARRLAGRADKTAQAYRFQGRWSSEWGLWRDMPAWQWIAHQVFISSKSGELMLLVANPGQLRLQATIRWFERRKLPVRVIILKARQIGFCASPETRVLTADLRWMTLDELSPGTEIVAVDESPTKKGKGHQRKMRTGVVEAKSERWAPALRLRMSNGEGLVLTAEHRMLCRQRRGDLMEWRAAEAMRVGDEIRYVTKPWAASSTEDGWFGGMLDGEGCFSHGSPGVVVSQLRGQVFDRMIAYCKSRGYAFCIENDRAERPSKFGKEPVPKIAIGRMNELFRLLGQTRPTRFIGRRWWEGRDLPGKRTGEATARIVSIEALPPQRMIDLQTSTKTFIAEGFVSHNSTWVQGLYFERVLRRENQQALLVAHKNDIGYEIANKFRRMLEELRRLPSDPETTWAIPLVAKGRSGIQIAAPIAGGITVASAEEEAPGHGITRQLLHLSEHSRWPGTQSEVEKKTTGIFQTVPDIPESCIVIESTANGDVGMFRDYFWAAFNNWQQKKALSDDGYRALFIGWWMHGEYRWSRTYGAGSYLPGVVPKEIEQEIHDTLSEEEQWLIAACHCDIDQLAWRRRTWASKCSRSWQVFDEQYPARPEQAFLASGRPAFPTDRLLELDKQATIPEQRGDLLDAEAALTERLLAPEFAGMVEEPLLGEEKE